MTDIPAWSTSYPASSESFLLQSLRSKSTSMGCYTQQLESELSQLTSYKYVVCMPNGSLCLLALLIALLPSVCRSVVVPNRTWLCTNNALEIIRHPYVLFDCEYMKPVLHINVLLDYIKFERPSLVIIALINGHIPENLNLLLDLCHKYSIPVIFDKCPSLLSPKIDTDKHLASFFSLEYSF